MFWNIPGSTIFESHLRVAFPFHELDHASFSMRMARIQLKLKAISLPTMTQPLRTHIVPDNSKPEYSEFASISRMKCGK